MSELLARLARTLTHRWKLSAVGAFLVGIALSGPLAHTARDLLTPLRDLFAAVFFVFFGLQTDPGDLLPVAGIAAALAAAGIATKAATGWIAGARAGLSPTARIRAGAALMPRGEFNIVIAGLALGGGFRAPGQAESVLRHHRREHGFDGESLHIGPAYS